MRQPYRPPVILSEKTFETSALACGKSPYADPGSWHFTSAYDTFTGHFGPGMGAGSTSGQLGVGFGPGGTSSSYSYSGLCSNWVGLAGS